MVSKRTRTRSGARRYGDDYQDMVALRLIIEMLEHPDRFKWIKVEADEGESLDDAIALRNDGRILYWQVKYSNYPEELEDALTWDMLLYQKPGKRGPTTSLLMKWYRSLKKLNDQSEIFQSALMTNREAASEFSATFGKQWGRIEFDKIFDSDTRAQIVAQLGDEAAARWFFSIFDFNVGCSDLDTLEQSLVTRFRALGGTDEGWLSLKDRIRLWVRERNEPPPSGQITYEIARRAAGFRQLRRLEQDLEIPDDYVLPSKKFHSDFSELIRRQDQRCHVLTGPPGAGKSTYLSYLVRELDQNQIPVIRHHYFLSVKHRGEDRALHERVAESLMSDLERGYPDAVNKLVRRHHKHEDLGEWLNSCGQYFVQLNTVLIVIIDGLDHVFREGRANEVRDLLYHLLPPPAGVVVILGTQPLDESLLPQPLIRHVPKGAWI